MFGNKSRTAIKGLAGGNPEAHEDLDHVELDADDLAQLDEDDQRAARRKKIQLEKRKQQTQTSQKKNDDEFGDDVDIQSILANARQAAAEVMDLGGDVHMNFDEKDLENDPELLDELAGLHEGNDELAELDENASEDVPSMDAKIASLEERVKALQIEAVSHKRSGDKAKALEVMRTIKAAKSELEELQHKREEYERRKQQKDVELESEDLELVNQLKALSLHGEDEPLSKEEPSPVDYDAEIAAWEDRIKKAAADAVTFKKAGQKEKAIEAMKHYKNLQDKFKEFKAEVDQLRELQKPDESMDPSNNSDQANAEESIDEMKVSKEDQKKIDLVNKRIKEYQVRAIEQKRYGNAALAKQILLDVRKMKELVELLEFGEGNIRSVPKPLDSRPEYSLLVKESVTEDDSLISHRSESKSGSSQNAAAPSSGPSKGIQAKLEYKAIIKRLSEQFTQAETDIKTIKETAKGQPQSELPAIKRRLKAAVEARNKILKEIDIVEAAASQGLPPPAYHIDHVMVQRELFFPDIKTTEMVVHVKDGIDFKPPDGWSISTSYVVVEFGLPSLSKVTKTSSTIENNDNPPFDFSTMFQIPPANKIGKSFKFAKVEFKVLCPRSFSLLSPVLLGEADLKIGDFTENKCEIDAEVALKRKGRPVGKLHVIIRIRQPFKGKDIREVASDVLVVDQFYDDSLSSSFVPKLDPNVESKLEHARRKSSGKSQVLPSKVSIPNEDVKRSPPGKIIHSEGKSAEPVTSVSSNKPPPPVTLDRSMSSALIADDASLGSIPDEIDPHDWKSPHNMDLLVSNDVLQAEFDSVSTAIATLRAKRQTVPPALDSRYKKCQLKMMFLQNEVGEGRLTLPMYLKQVEDSMQYHIKLIKALKAANRIDDAKKALARVKIMQEELKSAEAVQKESSE